MQLYSISIIAKNSNHPPIDIDTQYAIREIVKHFFEDTQRTIIYLCTFEDKKEIKRFKKFNRWLENDDFNVNLVKLDGVIGEIYFTSIIYHKNNKLSKKILEIFKLSIDNFNSK